MNRIIFVICAGLTLGGCASADGKIGTVIGGECRLFHTPEYEVRGRTAYDQKWINVTTEAGVDGCGQPRPKARPASLDAPRVKAAPTATAAPKPKKKWWKKTAPQS
jgi:hypothetical protein